MSLRMLSHQKWDFRSSYIFSLPKCIISFLVWASLRSSPPSSWSEGTYSRSLKYNSPFLYSKDVPSAPFASLETFFSSALVFYTSHTLFNHCDWTVSVNTCPGFQFFQKFHRHIKSFSFILLSVVPPSPNPVYCQLSASTIVFPLPSIYSNHLCCLIFSSFRANKYLKVLW